MCGLAEAAAVAAANDGKSVRSIAQASADEKRRAVWRKLNGINRLASAAGIKRKITILAAHGCAGHEERLACGKIARRADKAQPYAHRRAVANMAIMWAKKEGKTAWLAALAYAL